MTRKRKPEVRQEDGRRVIVDYVSSHSWEDLAVKVNAMADAGAELVGSPVVDSVGINRIYVQCVKVTAQ